ncbi:aminodeoxychorismate/anthranilate synthase component II [Rickettsiales bacterium]|nr:aminodeoxychorismate/anthranilate synthase component II [Rickettsiales bacterium]
MIILIDNYDSFTFNLYHYIIESSEKYDKEDIMVVRNDKISKSKIKELNPDAIILSPGPCTPKEAGISIDIVQEFKGKIPILGICLGHQTIGEAFGGKIIKTEPMHGKISNIYHNNTGIFHNIPSPFKSTRYHSLIIEDKSLPECFNITAKTEDGIIMAIQHKEFNIHGLQFHPESIASEYGHDLIKNFLDCF